MENPDVATALFSLRLLSSVHNFVYPILEDRNVKKLGKSRDEKLDLWDTAIHELLGHGHDYMNHDFAQGRMPENETKQINITNKARALNGKAKRGPNP